LKIENKVSKFLRSDEDIKEKGNLCYYRSTINPKLDHPSYLNKVAKGVVGAGGIIYGLDGKELLHFAWGLSFTSNNQAEALAVYMGIQIY
jgi:hypothetical protein